MAFSVPKRGNQEHENEDAFWPPPCLLWTYNESGFRCAVADGATTAAFSGEWAQQLVRAFGEGQVSTYVILGMGEDPQVTVEGCRRAIDLGVYPFIVPLRPTAGSLMALVAT